MNLRQKAASGVVWSVVQKWGRSGISIIIFIALSRMLSPDAFGLVALASTFTVFVELFLDQGFSTAIVQRVHVEQEHLDTAFWVGILTSALLTACCVAASGLAAAFFHEPRLAPILRWLSLGFIISALSSTQIAIIQRRLAFRTLATRSLVATTVGGVVGLAMALTGFGVWSLVGQDLASGVTGVVVLWGASDWRPGFRVSKKHYKDLFSFGISVVGNNALNVLVRRSDDFLIGYFLGPTLLGFYTIGYQLLVVIIRLVTEVTNSVVFPTFSRIQHQPERMRRAFYNVTQYTSLLAFPIFIGIAVLAPEIVPTVFGEKWRPSIPVMQVLALIGILQSVLFFNGTVIRASGKPTWQFVVMLINAICSVFAFLLAVHWGIVAVAASFVIVSYLLSPISYLAVRRLIEIDFGAYIRQFAAPLAASVAMVIMIFSMKYFFSFQTINSYVELSTYLITGALTYMLVIGLTAPSLCRQLLELVSLVLPRRKLRRTL